MELKTCSKCGKTYPATTEFFYCKASGRDGLYPRCKTCMAIHSQGYYAAHKEERLAYSRAYYASHREERLACHRAYSAAHREEIVARDRAYYEVHKEHVAACQAAHKEARRARLQRNRAHINEVERQRLQASPALRISEAISRGIRNTLHNSKAGRPWESLIGYTLDDLRQHLQARFQIGMSWENYGLGGWVIDHVRPIASFHFGTADDPEFKECWALENLQPMWWSDNQRKSAREPALLATDQRVRRRQK